MPTSAAVDATVEGLLIPSLPKHSGKPDYTAIKETHQLLTLNEASIEYNLGRGQNGYLGLILPPDQYARFSGTAFILPPKPGRMEKVPEWTPPTEEKRLLIENAEQRRM